MVLPTCFFLSLGQLLAGHLRKGCLTRLLLTESVIAQLGGTTLGLSLGGLVFQNILIEKLDDILPDTPRSVITNLIDGSDGGETLSSLTSAVQERVIESIVKALTET